MAILSRAGGAPPEGAETTWGLGAPIVRDPSRTRGTPEGP